MGDSDDQGSQVDKADKVDQGGQCDSGQPGKSEDGLKNQEAEERERDYCNCRPKNSLKVSTDCCEFDPKLLLQALQEDFV